MEISLEVEVEAKMEVHVNELEMNMKMALVEVEAKMEVHVNELEMTLVEAELGLNQSRVQFRSRSQFQFRILQLYRATVRRANNCDLTLDLLNVTVQAVPVKVLLLGSQCLLMQSPIGVMTMRMVVMRACAVDVAESEQHVLQLHLPPRLLEASTEMPSLAICTHIHLHPPAI